MRAAESSLSHIDPLDQVSNDLCDANVACGNHEAPKTPGSTSGAFVSPGEVTGNTVDGHGAVSPTFSGADPGAVACGIGVEDNSTAVIGAHAFPGPPGNEHHVRDTQSS